MHVKDADHEHGGRAHGDRQADQEIEATLEKGQLHLSPDASARVLEKTFLLPVLLSKRLDDAHGRQDLLHH